MRSLAGRQLLMVIAAALALLAFSAICRVAQAGEPAGVARLADPLSTWNAGPAKQALLDFVAAVTDRNSPLFVPRDERIAVFDHDGTLWVEQPFYVQGEFLFDRAEDLFEETPKLAIKHAARALFRGNRVSRGRLDSDDAVKLLSATHAGLTPAEFREAAIDWLKTARHPRFHRRYTECVYVPMCELVAWLHRSGFQVWICSGGENDFVRCFSEEVYGIPPERVIGTSVQTRLESRSGAPVLVRTTDLVLPISDRDGKPVVIARHIGRRPILAFGNSDGDIEMLQYADSREGASLAMLLRHDDQRREYAYDRDTRVGRLDKALDLARERHWVVVSMKRDFKVVFPDLD